MTTQSAARIRGRVERPTEPSAVQQRGHVRVVVFDLGALLAQQLQQLSATGSRAVSPTSGL